MDELAVIKRPSNSLGSSILGSTLQRILKRVMKEVVEDKKVELRKSGTKIPAIDVDVLCLIDTSYLYGMINNGINRYHHDCNTVQGFTNDMVGNADAPTVVEGIHKATMVSKLVIAIPVVVHENNHGNTKLTDTELESNNTLGANIMKKEGWFYEWADMYDEWNNYYYIPTEENEPGSSHTFTGDNSIFKLTKTKHNGRSKRRLVSEISTPIKSNFCIGKRQS